MNHQEESRNRKKEYLAPLLLLLFCFATLTGAAYAYTTEYTLGGHEIGTDYYSIDFTDEEGNCVTATIPPGTRDLEIYTVIVDGVTTMYSDGEPFTREAWIIVNTDKTCQFTVKTEVTGDSVLESLVTIEDVDDVVVNPNEATKIVLTFTPIHAVDLSTVGLTEDTTDHHNIRNVAAEIEGLKYSVHFTADPVVAVANP